MWLNLWHRPIERATLESWARFSEDIAKVALLALPIVLYGDQPVGIKALNITLLVSITYLGLLFGKHLRKHQHYFMKGTTT
ncbi:MAG: hypothetical protein KA214_07700 [Neisseriaceae bacterium]|nr:hypothetical protein [Neisseriaceae bacterium]